MTLRHVSEPERDEIPQLENLESKQFPATEDSDLLSAVDADLDQWLRACNAEELTYGATLYRVKDNRLWVLEEYENAFPTLHEMGMKFGGGSYRLIVHIPRCKQFPKGTIKAKKINIDPESYRQKRIDAGIIPDVPANMIPQFSQSDSRREMLEMFSSFSAMIKNLAPPAVVTPAPTAVDALQQYAVLQDVLKKNLFDNIEMQKQLTEKFLNQPLQQSNNMGSENREEPEEEKEEASPLEGLLGRVLPLIDRFLPLLAGNSPATKITIEALRSQPEYQALLKDNLSMRKMIAEIRKRAGSAKTQKVLSNLRLDDQGRPIVVKAMAPQKVHVATKGQKIMHDDKKRKR